MGTPGGGFSKPLGAGCSSLPSAQAQRSQHGYHRQGMQQATPMAAGGGGGGQGHPPKALAVSKDRAVSHRESKHDLKSH